MKSTAETRERLVVSFAQCKVVLDLVRPERHFCRRGDKVATNPQSNRLGLALRSHNYLNLQVARGKRISDLTS